MTQHEPPTAPSTHDDSATPAVPSPHDAPATRDDDATIRAVWASDVTYEIGPEPPKEPEAPTGSQRYFTIAVAIVAAAGAIIGILAS